jgi:hypothetical protein
LLKLKSWPDNPSIIHPPNPNEVTYEQISRSPESYTDSLVVLKGKIIQAVDDGTDSVFRINVTPSQDFRFFNDTVYVEYHGEQYRRLLEGNIIDVTGEFAGIKSYRSVLGATIQVPFVRTN